MQIYKLPQKLAPQKVMVKTTKRPDHSRLAIFCAIFYWWKMKRFVIKGKQVNFDFWRPKKWLENVRQIYHF